MPDGRLVNTSLHCTITITYAAPYAAPQPKYTKFGCSKQAPQLSPRAVLPALCVSSTESSKRWAKHNPFSNFISKTTPNHGQSKHYDVRPFSWTV